MQHLCKLLGFTEAYNLIKFQPSNYSQMIFTEAPITEYEHSRNEEIMKNNQELERLGIKALVPIVNNTSVERKGKDHEVSGSLYIGQESGQESEDCEDEEVISKVPSLLSICLFVLYCFLLCVSMLFSKFGANSACFFCLMRLCRLLVLHIQRIQQGLGTPLLEEQKHLREWWHLRNKMCLTESLGRKQGI